MATYTVKWSTTGQPGGKPAIVVPEKTFNDTATSLVLTGKGLNNYGLFQQENFLRLLENFAGPTPPPHPTVGQLWYDTATCTLKVYGCSQTWTNIGGGGGNLVIGDINDYMGDGSSILGFAERINRILGTPGIYTVGANSEQFGWGQTDYVPTYNPDGSLDTLALSREPGLPGTNVFPTTFSNSAWAIAISRLRKALRQTGLNETATSVVGFVDDGQPSGSGDVLANEYNNYPTVGSMANILAGFGAYSSAQVQTFFDATEAALDQLETYRFSLGPSQTQIQNISTRTRTAPAQSLGIPSTVNAYVHNIEVEFGSYDNARAFFNSGGQFQFNSSFNPSAVTPTNVENDWEQFLQAFAGFCFDYQGVKRSSTYASPSTTPEYIANGQTIAGVSVGFYDLNASPQVIFKRDVLDTPGLLNPYRPTTPTNGGLVISANTITAAGSFRIRFSIEFILRNVTTGEAYQNDTTDVSLTGTLTSSVNAIYANSFNRNSPTQGALAVPVDGGTFLTTP